jgi:maltose phosphorylase
MNQDYIKPDNWSIIEEGFDVERVKVCSALTAALWDNVLILKKIILAKHSKEVILLELSRQDKSRLVENGYPEYFAKVLNAPNWIDIEINGEKFDLNACSNVKNFRRELNMKEGWYHRSLKLL